MITVTVFTRPDCHLCDLIMADLQAIQAAVPHHLNVIDIEADPQYQKDYGAAIPVVKVGPYTLKAPIERQDLEITMRAVMQREQQDAQIEADLAGGRILLGVTWTRADQVSLDLSRHYLAFFNILVGLYVGLSFLAPVLMKVGAEWPANALYKVYSTVCHQLPYRSWFLFGEQPYYPRSAAHVDDVIAFGTATGLSEGSATEDIWLVRSYVGDDQIGYKVALCQRDVAIYLAILGFGILFSFLRDLPRGRRLPALHWALWLLIGIFPIGLDGGTQLLSQFIPVLNPWLPFRESTPLLRTLTGALFGFTSAWFAYPLVDESFTESIRILERKRHYAHAQQPATTQD